MRCKGRWARWKNMAGTLPANRVSNAIGVQGPPYTIPPCPQGTHPAGREKPRARKTLSQEKPRRQPPPRATLPEQFLQFGGVVAGEDNVVVSDGVGQEVAGGLGGEPQDGLGAAEIGFGLAP